MNRNDGRIVAVFNHNTILTMYFKLFCIPFLAGAVALTANAETFSSGNLNFEICGNGICRLVASPDATGTVTLPSVLTYENIDYTLTELGPGALADAQGLEALLVPGSVTVIGSELARGCSALRIVELSDGVTEIGAEAFAGCTGLESVVLPDNLAEIPRRCFYGARSLQRVKIGVSTAEIGTQAFDACGSISSVVCMAVEPPAVGAYAFDPDALANATLTVPVGCRDSYAAESAWGAFRSIVESDYGDAEVLLTLVLPDGSISTRESLGSSVQLTLEAPAGWTIDRLTFNDMDVTDHITAGGVYSTPPLISDSELRLAVRSVAGIGNAGTTTAVARRISNRIIVEGLSDNDTLSIYTVDGRLLFRGTGNSEVAVDVTEPVIVVTPALKFIL